MITDQSCGEIFRSVERAKQEWESAVDTLLDPIAVVNQDLEVIRANRMTEQWCGLPVEQISGKNLHELFHPLCQSTPCYFLEALQLPATGPLTRTVQVEAFDLHLDRFIRLFVRPIEAGEDVQPPATVVLISDITELKKAEQLQEELIADLDAFAHTVAHDLKNPIGIITGYADLLTQNERLPAQEEDQALRTIGSIARKMNNIVEELMLFAQVRSAEVVKLPIEMPAILQEVLVRLEYDRHQADWQIILPDRWPTAAGYAPWVEEIWINLIINAIKYGGTPPRVELGGEQLTAETARFWVKDNGPGISPEIIERLFSSQPQVSHLKVGSHGLGLSIVRRIVEKLGGQVSVDNNLETRPGTIFYFTLPTPQALAGEAWCH